MRQKGPTMFAKSPGLGDGYWRSLCHPLAETFLRFVRNHSESFDCTADFGGAARRNICPLSVITHARQRA